MHDLFVVAGVALIAFVIGCAWRTPLHAHDAMAGGTMSETEPPAMSIKERDALGGRVVAVQPVAPESMTEAAFAVLYRLTWNAGGTIVISKKDRKLPDGGALYLMQTDQDEIVLSLRPPELDS